MPRKYTLEVNVATACVLLADDPSMVVEGLKKLLEPEFMQRVLAGEPIGYKDDTDDRC